MVARMRPVLGSMDVDPLRPIFPRSLRSRASPGGDYELAAATVDADNRFDFLLNFNYYLPDRRLNDVAKLKVQLLGPPQIEIDNEPVKINRRKAIALLAYLAVTQHSHNRDALATLFWPEANSNRARANLRQTLWELNNALCESWIETEDETLALRTDPNVWVDVHAFQASLAACHTHGHPIDHACADCVPLLKELVTLYREDFLAGFSLSDSPAFDEWQYLEIENLRRKFADSLENLGNYLIGIGDFEAAIAAIRRWSALDPLDDTPHYRLLQLYAWTDQRAAAVREYRKYTKLLKQELGLGPREDISTLYQRIRRGRK